MGIALVGLLVCGLAGGCGDGPEDNPVRLSPRGMPYLTGVPVPAGFKLVEKNTEDYESGGKRWARHLYAGHAATEYVRNFYREQMPLMGWSRVSDHNVKGTITLRFEKDIECCMVEISPDGLFNRCEVQVIVMPFSRTSREPLKRPMP